MRRRGKNERNKKPYAPLPFLVAQGLLIKQSLSGCSQWTLSRDQPVASCTSRQAKEHSRLRLPQAWPISSVYGTVTSPPRVRQGNNRYGTCKRHGLQVGLPNTRYRDRHSRRGQERVHSLASMRHYLGRICTSLDTTAWTSTGAIGP